MKLRIKHLHVKLMFLDLLLTDTLSFCFVSFLVAETGNFVRLGKTSDHAWLDFLRLRLSRSGIAKVCRDRLAVTDADSLHCQIQSTQRRRAEAITRRHSRISSEIVWSIRSGIRHHASVTASWCTVGGIVMREHGKPMQMNTIGFVFSTTRLLPVQSKAQDGAEIITAICFDDDENTGLQISDDDEITLADL